MTDVLPRAKSSFSETPPLAYSMIFKDIQGFARTFKDFSRIFKDIQGFSKIFKEFKDFQSFFKDIRGFLRIFNSSAHLRHWGCLSQKQKGTRARWQLVYEIFYLLSNLPSRHWYYSNWNDLRSCLLAVLVKIILMVNDINQPRDHSNDHQHVNHPLSSINATNDIGIDGW